MKVYDLSTALNCLILPKSYPKVFVYTGYNPLQLFGKFSVLMEGICLEVPQSLQSRRTFSMSARAAKWVSNSNFFLAYTYFDRPLVEVGLFHRKVHYSTQKHSLPPFDLSTSHILAPCKDAERRVILFTCFFCTVSATQEKSGTDHILFSNL